MTRIAASPAFPSLILIEVIYWENKKESDVCSPYWFITINRTEIDFLCDAPISIVNHKRKHQTATKTTFEQKMNLERIVFLLVILLGTTSIVSGWAQRRRQLNNDRETNGLRYMVGLSEPLQSTLEWDYGDKSGDKLRLRWNITLTKGQAGILAFSNYDLETDGLDMFVFRGEELYNLYTDEQSSIIIPKDGIDPSLMLQDSDCVEKKKQMRCTIEILRPLDTCDEEQRNYIIDRGTIQLLTGILSASDFQNLQRKKSIKVDVERMNLTLQRVQLLKPQVSDAQCLRDGLSHFSTRSISNRSPMPNLIWTISMTTFSFPMSKQRIGALDSSCRHPSWKHRITSFVSTELFLHRVTASFTIWNYSIVTCHRHRKFRNIIRPVRVNRSRWV